MSCFVRTVHDPLIQQLVSPEFRLEPEVELHHMFPPWVPQSVCHDGAVSVLGGAEAVSKYEVMKWTAGLFFLTIRWSDRRAESERAAATALLI